MRISRDASGALAAAAASVGAGRVGVGASCCAFSVELEKRQVMRPKAKVAANLGILIIVGLFLDGVSRLSLYWECLPPILRRCC